LAVEWLLVDTPDPVTAGRTRTALLHVPHIACIRVTPQGLMLFLRDNHMVTTLVDGATLARLDALVAQGLWGSLMSAPPTREWQTVGRLLVNCVELSAIEFDVPRDGGVPPTKARVTTTFHGENGSIASDDDAQAWWVFALARGRTVGQLVGAEGEPDAADRAVAAVDPTSP
jgi:hypothetical protein